MDIIAENLFVKTPQRTKTVSKVELGTENHSPNNSSRRETS